LLRKVLTHPITVISVDPAGILSASLILVRLLNIRYFKLASE
jgi:hypothetical protein